METTTKKRKSRPPRQAPPTDQLGLFPLAPPPGPLPAGPETAPSFQCPRPETMFIGDVPLRAYLQARGLGWVIRLRTLLEGSDHQALLEAYQADGRHAIHPVVMLGLIIYGLLDGKWSLRELEGLAQRDVGAWWLCGGLQPDHSTIGKFLVRHAQVLTAEYFTSLTRGLLGKLRLPAGSVSGDGTVIEAAASRFQTLQAEAAREQATEARRLAAERPGDAGAQARARLASAAAAAAQERGEKREAKGRDPAAVRVCPTEPEAVVQPLKNGAVRPSYKPSILANAQRIILGVDVHPSDEVASLRPLLAQHESITGVAPTRTLLDAGYHCLAVLGLFVEQDLDLLCPSGKADRQQWEKRNRCGHWGKSAFRYEEAGDVYVCPAGRKLVFKCSGINANGQAYRQYRSADCRGCECAGRCTDGRLRTVKRYAGEELKEAMAQVLSDERARRAYRQRRGSVEPVFGDLRYRQGLTRFRRRGLGGARLEFVLHCIAYNLRRAIRLEGRESTFLLVVFALVRPIGRPWIVLCLWWAKKG